MKRRLTTDWERQPSYDGEWFTYPNGYRINVSDTGCTFTASDWHSGQWTALYRLSCSDLSPENITDAEAELRRSVDATTEEQWAEMGEDVWMDAASALETLETWAANLSDLQAEA